MTMEFPRLTSINIKGFKCFRDFSAEFSEFEVFVGANGTGKTSMFEFLRFIRDGAKEEIPAEVIKGTAGQAIFNSPNKPEFTWAVSSNFNGKLFDYTGILKGPEGRIKLTSEQLTYVLDGRRYTAISAQETPQAPKHQSHPDAMLEMKVELSNSRALALASAKYPRFENSYQFSEYCRKWRFFKSLDMNLSQIRKSIPTEQDAVLREDAGNLSAVLFNLFADHDKAFDDLQFHLKSVIPGFRGIKIKPRGGPGEVIAFWTEDGVEQELTMADLSDGVLHFIIWATLCVHPNPPPLICIDEPEVGMHPRALPLLAALLEKATERTQVFIATHSSYLLSQFPFQNIIVMAKENGEVVAKRPSDSKTLNAMLEDFGPGEIAALHQSDELEADFK
jgi:predicted ATPase